MNHNHNIPEDSYGLGGAGRLLIAETLAVVAMHHASDALHRIEAWPTWPATALGQAVDDILTQHDAPDWVSVVALLEAIVLAYMASSAPPPLWVTRTLDLAHEAVRTAWELASC